MKPKKDLIRIVKAPQDLGGGISVDQKGKKPGRGAYVCPAQTCLAKAKKIRVLERTFDCTIDDAVYAELARQIQEGVDT